MARAGAATAVVLLIALAAGGAGWWGNKIEARHRLTARVHALTGGDPDRGRRAVAARPCGGCHQIPGIPGATGKVGPPLTAFSGRSYIAGRLNNTPDNLIGWLMNPHAVDPQSVMPPMGIGEREARDIAAYLYTLK